MGGAFLIAILTILGLLIVSFITSVILWKKRKKGWIILSGSVFLLCLSIFFVNSITEIPFGEADVTSDLKYAKIELIDDFEIINNDVYGIPERFQETELIISNSDAIAIINKIKNSKDFIESNNNSFSEVEIFDGKKNEIVTTDYKFLNRYYREAYYRKKNYVPIHLKVSIKEDSNILIYERNEY